MTRKTAVSVLHDAQLLLNKQQQIWGVIYIHKHLSSSTDTVGLLENSLTNQLVCRGLVNLRTSQLADSESWNY